MIQLYKNQRDLCITRIHTANKKNKRRTARPKNHAAANYNMQLHLQPSTTIAAPGQWNILPKTMPPTRKRHAHALSLQWPNQQSQAQRFSPEGAIHRNPNNAFSKAIARYNQLRLDQEISSQRQLIDTSTTKTKSLGAASTFLPSQCFHIDQTWPASIGYELQIKQTICSHVFRDTMLQSS